jgi:hypothetical protein
MRFLAKLTNLLFRTRAEKDLTREITAHLTLLQDEYEQRGMPPALRCSPPTTRSR